MKIVDNEALMDRVTREVNEFSEKLGRPLSPYETALVRMAVAITVRELIMEGHL